MEQARALIAVATAASGKNRRARSNRALFYGTMILAGLRVTETSRLRWRDLDLDSPTPSLTTDPSWSKNRRELRVALAPELADQLRRERERCNPQPTDFVFPAVPNRATWRLDREAAGVPPQDRTRAGADAALLPQDAGNVAVFGPPSRG